MDKPNGNYCIVPSYAGGNIGRWWYVMDTRIPAVLSRHTNKRAADIVIKGLLERGPAVKMDILV